MSGVVCAPHRLNLTVSTDLLSMSEIHSFVDLSPLNYYNGIPVTTLTISYIYTYNAHVEYQYRCRDQYLLLIVIFFVLTSS